MFSRLLSIFVIYLLCGLSLFAQEEKSGQAIIDVFINTLESNALMNSYQQNFEVRKPGNALESIKKVITIMNEKGREHASEAIFYDKFRKLRKLEGRILDTEGNVIQKKISKENIEDLNYNSMGTFYDDSRVRIVSLYHTEYPYVIELEYQIEHTGLLTWPTWYPQQPDIATLKSTFKVAVPLGTELRYKTRNTDLQPTLTDINHSTYYQWEATMLPEWKNEPYSPHWQNIAPAILTAPTLFELGGYEGMMDTWESFGKWYQKLGENRLNLSNEKKVALEEMVKDATTDLEKAKIIYEHLQQTTRYVSIQLGIGGWQPYEASYVEKNQFGDCKALTNYMQALLQAVGIEAYPALVNAGRDELDIDPDFPMNQFNHVILGIPDKDDEGNFDNMTWLECTSSLNAFGHLGDFTEDRNVLLITPNGGVLTRTPKSSPEDNQQNTEAFIKLLADGKGTIEVKMHFTGNQQDRVRGTITLASNKERDEWLRKTTNLPAFTLNQIDFSDLENRSITLDISFTASLQHLATRSGKRLFIQPNLLNQWGNVPPDVENRTQPIRLPYPFLDTDSTSIALPEGYSVETISPPISLETPFANYEASATISENNLIYKRSLRFDASKLAATSYSAYQEFLLKVKQADQTQVVLVKK